MHPATACTQIHTLMARVNDKCLGALRLKPRLAKKRSAMQISAPYDFKPGPAVHLPGYSEDEISLMKDQAIASTAIHSESEPFDIALYGTRRRAGSGGSDNNTNRATALQTGRRVARV